MDFVGKLLLFLAVKNRSENPLRIDKVIAMSLMHYFSGPSVDPLVDSDVTPPNQWIG